ncbi:MAG TPA: cation:proton antiporter [Thermoplasmata archaeon]|nr:cation:proton antiporter [Thermoplasmata archaeon]
MAAVPDVAEYALLEVFIFLALAELLVPVARRARLPPVVAWIVLGIALSNFALGGVVNHAIGVDVFGASTYLLLFADLSVVLLLFAAGLGSGVRGLRDAGASAVGAALAGDLVPFALTVVVASRFVPLDTSLLLGVATAPTSAAVVAALRQTEKVGDTAAGTFLINTAALDDVVALLLLTVVLTIVGGHVDILSVTGSVAESALAWVVLLVAAVVVIPRLLRLPALREAKGMPFLFLFVLVAVVVALGFSAVIGAFIAGLAVAESLVADRTRELTEVLLLFFGALFFVVVGVQFNVHDLVVPALVGAGLGLAALAAAGKVAGVYPFARAKLREPAAARAVVVGMVPRGEIGLVVGAIGLTSGLFGQAELGAIVLMALATTVGGSWAFRGAASVLRAPSAPPPSRVGEGPTRNPGP